MKQRATYSVVLSGLLVAMSIVLTRVFSANLMIVGVPASRLSIGYLPIILAGVILGPWWGAGVGLLADAVGFLIFPSGTYFPPIALTSALAGVLPALIYRYAGKLPEWLKALLAVSAVQVGCSILLQTYWLTVLYGKAFGVLFVPRAIVAAATVPIYFLFVYSVLSVLKRARLFPRQTV